MAKIYAPSPVILKRYAEVLVSFALGGGRGIKRGDVVYINGSESTKPLLLAVRRAVWEAGGHVLMHYFPNGEDRYNFSADFFAHASNKQLDFFPAKYFKGLVDEMDHVLFILGDSDPHSLKNSDPKKIMRRGKAMKQFLDWRRQKEHQDKLSWSLALYGTPGMAKEAGLSIEQYWHEIIQACFLDEKNPIAKWNKVYKQIHAYNKKLDALSPKIDKLHIEAVDADLWITLGAKRKWLSGRGANIPSFEIFTSPDWRGTNGWIRFNQPLYRYGSKVTDIELWFKDGKVIKSKAKTGEKLLREMIATPGADRIGEFSMTDKRFSRITKFMAETLFDENVGGPQGNSHVALGSSFHDAYSGDVKKFTPQQAKALGFNDSSVHTDIITTTRRTVTAYLKNGSTKVIYKDGQYTL